MSENELVWVTNIKPTQEWDIDTLLHNTPIQLDDDSKETIQIEWWEDIPFLTWDKNTEFLNFNLQNPYCTIKFKSDKLVQDYRSSNQIKQMYSDINITTYTASPPKPNASNVGGYKMEKGYKINLPKCPFMSVTPSYIRLKTIVGNNYVDLKGDYNDNHTVFTLTENYESNNGVWKIEYKYSAELNKSSIAIQEIGWAMFSIDGYLWDDVNLETIVEEQDSYIEDSIRFVQKVELANQNFFITDDMVDNHGSTISKNNLDELASITTIDDYYIGDNSMQVLNFKHNQHNSDNDGNYCFDDSNAKYFGINQLTTPNKFATIPHIYPEIVFNTTDGSHERVEMEIKLTDTQLSIGETKYTLSPDDVVIQYTREPGEISNETSATTFWNPTKNTDLYKPNRSLITLELEGSFTEKPFSILQLTPGSNTPNYVITTDQPVYKKFLKRIICTTQASSCDLYIRGVSDLIGSKANSSVFQFGKYNGYKEGDWQEHCQVIMKLSGKISYISNDRGKTFNDIVNYVAQYNSSISEHCPRNGDMTAYIANESTATIKADYVCGAGTLPQTIPFFKPTPYFTTTVRENLTVHNYYALSYSSKQYDYTDDSNKHKDHTDYCQYKSQTETFVINITGGSSHSVSDEFTIDMRFQQKEEPINATAIVIWRNLKPYLNA